MTQDELKQTAANAAIEYLVDDAVIGVGTGSTANFFIDQLAKVKRRFRGAVASSEGSAKRLRAAGIEVIDMNEVDDLPVYFDGADEVTNDLMMVKGGGGALTREKIVAAMSKTFVCVADQTKLVSVLGKFPLPLEVIPMARAYVAREVAKLGGRPQLREGFTTDNGNIILDVHNLLIVDPAAMESQLNNVVGIVTNGLFARRRADVLLLATTEGVKRYTS